MSGARGVLKQIIGLFKRYLKSTFAGIKDGERLIDVFVCLNIVCPKASYDANIEPAKDDVLFSDADLVLQYAEEFFKDIYGTIQGTYSV